MEELDDLLYVEEAYRFSGLEAFFAPFRNEVTGGLVDATKLSHSMSDECFIFKGRGRTSLEDETLCHLVGVNIEFIP